MNPTSMLLLTRIEHFPGLPGYVFGRKPEVLEQLLSRCRSTKAIDAYDPAFFTDNPMP